MDWTVILLTISLLGVVGGLMAGALGLAGGTVVVPVLAWLFIHQGMSSNDWMPMALGTSLAILIMTTSSAAITHWRLGNIDYGIFKVYAPFLLLGALIGSQLAGRVPVTGLQLFFSIFLIYTAVRVGLGNVLVSGKVKSLPSLPVQRSFAVVFGTLSMFLGIAGGVMMIPHFCERLKREMRVAVGTGSICGIGIACVGALGYASYPPISDAAFANWSSGYVYWPAVLGVGIIGMCFAPVGAHFAHRLPAQTLRRIFAVILLIVAVRMGMTVWTG